MSERERGLEAILKRRPYYLFRRMGRLEQVIVDFLEVRGSELVLCFVGVGIRDHVALAEQRNEERLALPRPEGRKG